MAQSVYLEMCEPGRRNTADKTCIIDGDTLWLRGENIRLEDFDTPEPQTNICGGEAEIALVASASSRLRQLLRRRHSNRGGVGAGVAGWRRVVVSPVTAEDVDLSLRIGWAAFENHVQVLAEGELSRDLMYAPMRIEANALIRLLKVAPESEHGKIHELLGRYHALMATLVN